MNKCNFGKCKYNFNETCKLPTKSKCEYTQLINENKILGEKIQSLQTDNGKDK